MLAYLLKRLGIGAATLFVASIVVFAVLEVLPGDPAQLMLGINATPEALEALREQMGLTSRVVWRYLDWIGGMLTLDFGRSFTYSVPVIDLVARAPRRVAAAGPAWRSSCRRRSPFLSASFRPSGAAAPPMR